MPIFKYIVFQLCNEQILIFFSSRIWLVKHFTVSSLPFFWVANRKRKFLFFRFFIQSSSPNDKKIIFDLIIRALKL